MPRLDVPVAIFDPLLPTRRIDIVHPGIDTWHDKTLMARVARNRVPDIPSGPPTTIEISGGMRVAVETVTIRVAIGSVVIDELTVAVVDEGHHDILFGSDVLTQLFKVGQGGRAAARVSSQRKDDPSALAVELYPVDGPLELRRFSDFLRSQTRLHNIALIATGRVRVSDADIDSALDSDNGIPEHLRLKLAWIDSGSIWTTLKSGSKDALQYVGSFFQTGASAKLAQEVAAAQEASHRGQVNAATREATIAAAKAEQERLEAESVAATYRVWREEARERIRFTDEMLERVEDPTTRALLRSKRDEAIVRLLEQPAMPIVRNVPHEPEMRSSFLLPPSRGDAKE